MVRIKRLGRPLQLAETHRLFKEAIQGKSRKEAYDFYVSNKGRYQYNTEETKGKFKKMNHKRCSFCTRYIFDFDTEMTVEHIKIKRDYPKKIFQWNNLLCACRTCNTKRSVKNYERDHYLDPTKIPDIEDYFWFELDGTIGVNKELETEKQQSAQYMIDMYELNRDNLVCERRNFLKKLMEDDEFFESLKKDDISSQNIIFLSLFTYYRRCIE